MVKTVAKIKAETDVPGPAERGAARSAPDDTPSRLRITVLAGGPGPEREVSLESGRKVAEALTGLSHDVRLRDIAPDDLSALDDPADLFFIALHGTFGEDGRLQRIMDSRNLVYTGSDAAASALAMDKAATKARWMEHHIPTPEYCVLSGRDTDDRGGCKVDAGLDLDRMIQGPCVVKPVDSGSSVDTFIVSDASARSRAIRRVVDAHGKALVERYVDGPELTVGLLHDQPLPVCQIQTDRPFYDYQAKYLDDATRYVFDIDLPDELLASIQAMSVEAARVLGVREFARVDWMLDAKTMLPFALETNTIPGFTSHSLLPKAAERIGLSYAQLCQRIVVSALARTRV